MKTATELIHRPRAAEANMINPPIHRGSTVLFKNFEDLTRANAGTYEGILYGTDRLPAQRSFEEALCALEGGRLTRAFQSGLAAILGTFYAFTKAGDHILLCDNAYGPGQLFCRDVLSRFGVTFNCVPANVGADIVDYLKPNTRLILLESPGSNSLEIQDIPAVAAVAKARGILTALDNTWATPLYLDPFRHGVDLSIHSVSKYISGHSDILLGAVTATDRCAEALDHYCRVTETYAQPEDCHLALRGLKTLPVRLKQHEQSALEIARWLELHPAVGQVIHPALPCHPEHALWKRDFTGSTGLFSFTLKQEPEPSKLAAFIDSLRLFGIGYSWGGYHSLVTAARHHRALPSRYDGRTLVRLSIGLEDPEDLKADLEQGLARLY
jgi:cysteine-S-conjugate beta-lyase